MITYVVGDLFTSPAKVLVNTVNTVGVMGKGIAKDFKRIYPEMFDEYRDLCEQEMFNVGQLWLYKTPHKWILNFPTKKHWRGKSKIDYIEAGLRKFADTYDEKGIESISFPMLGCGHGGLGWEEEVQPLMEEHLQPLPIDIFIHLYGQNDLPVLEQRSFEEKKKWLQGEPQYPLFVEFWDDVKELIPSEQKSSLKQETLPGFGEIIAPPKPTEHSESTISKGIIEELWELMKSEGYIRIDNFPEAMKDDGHIIASFLHNLPYIQQVWLSDQPEVTEEDLDLGLQLIPEVSERKAEPQKTLM